MVQSCPHRQVQLEMARTQPGQTVTCHQCGNTIIVTGDGGVVAPSYPRFLAMPACATAVILLVSLVTLGLLLVTILGIRAPFRYHIITQATGPGRVASILSNDLDANVTLRTLAMSQAQFQSAGLVDQDEDGVGEFGFLQELAGAAPTRGSRFPARPLFITSTLGNTAQSRDGVARMAGYCFLVYLPDGQGGWIAESAALPAAEARMADAQEQRWICYAWPERCGTTGNRAFVVNQARRVFCTANRSFQAYGGTTNMPSPDAAFVRDAEGHLVLSAGVPAGDGQIWVPSGF